MRGCRLAALCCMLSICALAFCGCAGSDRTVVETPKSDLANLEVGSTAVFADYEVTVSGIDVTDDGIVASVTVRAHNAKQSLKTRYLEGDIIETSFPDGKIDLRPWEEASGTITYKENTIDSLRWNNWSNEATWVFDNPKKAEAEKARADKESASAKSNKTDDTATKKTESGLESLYAWQAVEDYGTKEFPYGFKLHSLTGKLAEENKGDCWFLKATCEVKNAFGQKQEMNCEAVVSGSNSSPVVSEFSVY